MKHIAEEKDTKNTHFVATVIRQARIIHPKTILDVSSGINVINFLEKAGTGQKRIGADFSQKIELPFKSNTFDLVICCNVLQNMDNPRKALAELYRVTKQYIILCVPNQPWYHIATFLQRNKMSDKTKWNGDKFEVFVGTKFDVFTRKNPFPWTVLVAEKN